MSMEKSKPGNGKAAEKNRPPAPPPPAKGKAAPAAPAAPLPPLFRRADWLSFAITTLLVFIGYYLTLAPDLTLQDSGELAVASMYAGVPHPPGYPVWTVYTWLFTVLVPHANIAWRVALASAVAGAATCGLLAMIASRGTSMILESITVFSIMSEENPGNISGTSFGIRNQRTTLAEIETTPNATSTLPTSAPCSFVSREVKSGTKA